ncbi:methylated-DNA--[protein]-cysteine S-methyltransferase [Candidatus Latescibacterota bacterium]
MTGGGHSIGQPSRRRVFDEVDNKLTASTDILTRFGTVRLCWNHEMLYNVVIGPYQPEDIRTKVRRFLPPHPEGQALIANFMRYFNGQQVDFRIPLPPGVGNDLQRDIWTALQSIPYGTYETYGELALRLNLPVSRARNVGNAAAQNPLPIIYPCHRVVSATGSLTGYSAGVHWKTALLELEGVPVQHERVRVSEQ